jgi:molybdate transport system substrate-binding protein
VVYPGAVVASSKHVASAQAFLDMLSGASGRAVLARFGFLPPPAGVR